MNFYKSGYNPKKEGIIVERLRKKFLFSGIDTLTDSEVLELFLGTSQTQVSAKEIAKELMLYINGGLEDTSLAGLHDLSYNQLMCIKGISKTKALQIVAALELSKRIAQQKCEATIKVSKPETIANYFMERLRHKKNECFVEVFIDAKCQMTGYKTISEGSLTTAIVHPREVYKYAIEHATYSIVVLHNHPSGDPSPSAEDLKLTKRLQSAGEVIGIPLLDHIIIGNQTYKSLREESYL